MLFSIRRYYSSIYRGLLFSEIKVRQQNIKCLLEQSMPVDDKPCVQSKNCVPAAFTSTVTVALVKCNPTYTHCQFLCCIYFFCCCSVRRDFFERFLSAFFTHFHVHRYLYFQSNLILDVVALLSFRDILHT